MLIFARGDKRMELLQYIDANFSGVLSVAVSAITALVTLVYVIFTYKQMKASQASTETAIKQLQVSNQPCIITEISETCGSKCFSGTRRQLRVELNLENVGDSPALSVYAFAHLELQYTKHIKSSSNIVEMDFLPDFIKCIKVGENGVASVRFETFEINMLVEDLRINYEKNMMRLRTNSYHPPYRGTVLVIETYYRNVLGQWFKNTIRQEILWLNDKHAAPRKTNDINENTIPPRLLEQDTEFELQLVSPRLSVLSTELINSTVIEEKLEKYSRYLKY